jgi:hypothetical protein
MTAANDPAATPQSSQQTPPPASTPASTAIQEGPPAGEARIPLPPPPAAPDWRTPVEQLAAEVARLDRFLVVVVLVLAFLLASFPVRNSDFWMHLAVGRLIAQGQYTFGVDPFSYTSTVYWANHAWLYDLILYGLATLGGGLEGAGGTLLVVAKALLVTALAWVMLRISRPGQSLWAPAACTGLALITLSPRLLLQPTVVSFFFLGLTLYLLTLRRQGDRETRRQGDKTARRVRKTSWTHWWALPPLFALWVNLDAWFLLGPLTVGLYLLGQVLQQTFTPVRVGEDAPEPDEQRRLFVVLLAGLAACLLSPHHYHAFTWPPEFQSAALSTIHERDELLFKFYSPIEGDYFQPNVGWHAAGLAYFPLLLLGLASFALNFQGWRWWRALIWVAFALLSMYHGRSIAFFAVVAGPITALNLQDFATRRFGALRRVDQGWRVWALGGRALTLFVGVVLLALAWPGWLTRRPDEPRLSQRVGWRVEADLSLQRTAEQLHAWREQNLLREGEHGFNFIPDVANYCAWFCPQEKGFFDYRFQLFGDVADAFVDVRHALRGTAAQLAGAARRPTDWRQIFQKHRINHVIVNSVDKDAAQALVWLLRNWEQWALLYMDGQTTIFGWRDPLNQSGPEALRVPRYDPGPLAFGRNLPEEYRAPVERADPPRRRDRWALFRQGPAPRPLEVDTALRYLDYFQQMAPQWPSSYLGSWHVATWSGFVGAAGASPGSVAGPGMLALSTYYLFDPSPLIRFKDAGPAAAPVLAVRTARRAIAASPDNAQAYQALAQSYVFLWKAQEDRWTERPMTAPLFPRQIMRQVQLVSALQQALAMRPDNEELQLMLMDAYRQVEWNDQAIDHLRDSIKYTRAAGRRPGESLEQFSQKLEQLQTVLKELDTEVQRQQNDYELRAANQPLLVKAHLALERGLGKRALQVLLEADVSQFGPEEANLQVQLLLMTGRLDEVRDGLTPELRTVLGSNYDWYQALLGAASGDYGPTGEYLDKLIAESESSSAQLALSLLRGQTFQGFMGPGSLASLGNVAETVRQVAEYQTLRGLIALEAGDTATAAKYFQKALDTGGTGPAPLFFDGRPVAARYLQLLQAEGLGENARR